MALVPVLENLGTSLGDIIASFFTGSNPTQLSTTQLSNFVTVNPLVRDDGNPIFTILPNNGTHAPSQTFAGNLVTVKFTCAFNFEKGECVLLRQDGPYNVFETDDGKSVVTDQKQSKGDMKSIKKFKTLDDAIGSLIPRSLIEREDVQPIIPGTLGPLVPRTTTTITTTAPPTTNVPPTSAPNILPNWGGVDTTIDENDTNWNDATYYPIIVNMKLSSKEKLVYRPIINSPITEGTWSSDNVLIKPPNGYFAFPNIKAGIDAQAPFPFDEAIFFPPAATNSTNSTKPGGGSGKRTRKNKKSKTSNRKKHQSMRKRRRA